MQLKYNYHTKNLQLESKIINLENTIESLNSQKRLK